jgi:hypothetical protein
LRISQAALDECEGLFALHVETMKELVAYKGELFHEVADERDLCWQTLSFLTAYQFDRSQAAYCLFVNGLVWDAEIVIRAVYETMAKIGFLGASVPEVRNRLLDEFWNVLPAIYDRQGAQKASPAEKLSTRFGGRDDARVFEHLRNPEIFDVEPKLNRKARKEVEQRWSFSAMIASLSKNTGDHRRLPGIDGLIHIYGMASHLAHASPKAIDLMMDRASRGDDLHCLEVSHVCRMMSDLVSLGCFSLQVCEFALTGNWKMSDKLVLQFERMHQEIKPFSRRFARSQDDFYAQYESQSSGPSGDVASD